MSRAVFVRRITVISHPQNGTIHFLPISRAATVCGAFIYACSPCAWHEVGLDKSDHSLPANSGSVLFYFERDSHAHDLIILSVAMKVEKRSEALDLWKKLTWKGLEVGGGAQAPVALDRTFLLDRSTLRYGLGPVAHAMRQVGTGPSEKTTPCPISSHIWDIAISRRGLPIS